MGRPDRLHRGHDLGVGRKPGDFQSRATALPPVRRPRWIGNKLALGNIDIQAISMAKGAEITQAIDEAGYKVTELQASDKSGPVSLVRVVIPRKQVRQVMDLVNPVDLTSFVTVDEPQQVIHGYQQLDM